MHGPAGAGSAQARRHRHGIALRKYGGGRGGDPRDSGCLRVGLDELPDDFLAQPIAGDAVGAIHGPKNTAIPHTRRKRPCVDRHLHPRRHRRGSDSTMLANQVHNAPATVPKFWWYIMVYKLHSPVTVGIPFTGHSKGREYRLDPRRSRANLGFLSSQSLHGFYGTFSRVLAYILSGACNVSPS
jgi:hypothetical protein